MCRKTTLTQYCSTDQWGYWGPCNVSQEWSGHEDETLYDCAAIATTLFVRPVSLDLNNDGQWSQAEVEPIMSRLMQSGLTQLNLDAAMDNLLREIECDKAPAEN